MSNLDTDRTGDGGRRHRVVLTAADHERNGFVSLARWPIMSEADARAFIDAADEQVSDDSVMDRFIPEVVTPHFAGASQ